MVEQATCLYAGRVTHRRNTPVVHHFRYALYMVYLDLDEIPEVLGRGWFWGTHRLAIHRFRRADHLGPAETPLKAAVLDLVEERIQRRPAGPVRLLTNLRTWGYAMNPVSFYYCFSECGEVVEAIVAEVHNTPWGEQHCYVLDCGSLRENEHTEQQAKVFHVSPFMEMDMTYHWQVSAPGENLRVGIQNYRGNENLFGAHLDLQRRPFSRWSLFETGLKHPWMTAKVIVAIYWNALLLWWKGVPYVPHPDRSTVETQHE